MNRELLVLVCLFMAVTWAHSSDERIIEFDISQQRVDTALIQFAEQADLTLIVPFDRVEGKQANPLVGRFSISNGIQRLLVNTGFEPDLGELEKQVIILTNFTERDITVKENSKDLQSKRCKKKSGWFNNLIIGGVALGGSHQIACAQDVGTPAYTLEEIIVTAQKRERSIQDVQLAISAIDGDQLDILNTGGEDIRALAARVPNLNIESTFGRVYPRFYVRGQGNVDFRLNATQPVATYYDEVVLENPALRGMPIFDLERVEVLRGPQGTLWGKNTTGGAIHLISKKPSAETSGYGRVTVGDLGLINMETAIGGALSRSVNGRLSAIYQSRDGWVRNTQTGNDLDDYNDFAIRGQLEWQPSDAVGMLLRVHGRNLDGTSTLFNANANIGLDKDQISLESDDNNKQEVNQVGVSLNVNIDLGNVTLSSISAFETGNLFSSGDLDGSSSAENSQVNFSDLDNIDQITQELRLSSNGDGGLNWQAGVFYYQDDMSYTDTGSNLRSFGNHLSVNADSKSYAAFGQLTYDLFEKVNITGGLRYTKDERHLDHILFYFGPNPADPLNPDNALFTFDIPDLGAPTADVDDESSEVTGELSVGYRASEDVNWYARIAKGFRAGTIDGNAAFTPVVNSTKPETVISYELGVKSDLLGDRLRFNAAVFYYDYDDQQIFAFTGVNNAVELDNAEGGTGHGIELDINYLLSDNIRVSLGYGYLDTEYEGPTLVRNDFTDAFVDIDGNRFPNSPKHTANLMVEYEHSLANGSAMYLTTDWSYRSDVNFTTYSEPLLIGQGYLEGGVRLGYRSTNRDWDIALWGRNITDVEELTGYTTFTRVGVYTGPRLFGLDVSYKF